jgi:signal transduction histidine kinase
MNKEQFPVWKKIIPRSLFGRIFWVIFLVSFISILILWQSFESRLYLTLDKEAASRLKNISSLLEADLKLAFPDAIVTPEIANKIFREHSLRFGNWIQNSYWLNLSMKKPKFIASFSQALTSKKTMFPPTAVEAEDLVFDFINELDAGKTVFPDPFSYGISRRFKIILVPILDADGMLEAVIGIESDMEYLTLVTDLKSQFVYFLGLVLLMSILTGLILAKNLNTKTLKLLENINRVEEGKLNSFKDLRVVEFNRLNEGILGLGKKIADREARIKEFYNKKLDDLAFTGGAIAHEVRNPLSAIEMHFGLLKRAFKKNNIDLPESAKEVEQQLGHLKLLINDFLKYSRKVTPDAEELQIKEFLEDIVKRRKLVLGNFTCNFKLEQSPVLYFDKTMFAQVVENLINNAYEANPENLILTIFSEKKDDFICLSVADNGPGIPKNMVDKIFTPFSSTKEKGNGIGLAISRKLVEAHGGEMTCQNLPNGGARFIIEVPSK